ncbi:hypothetical protein YC2023_044027 [Brassica napus]
MGPIAFESSLDRSMSPSRGELFAHFPPLSLGSLGGGLCQIGFLSTHGSKPEMLSPLGSVYHGSISPTRLVLAGSLGQ